MATSSDIKAGLDEISVMIKICRRRLTEAKEELASQGNKLSGIPTTFQEIVEAVNGYTVDDIPPTDAFEVLCQAELAKMTTEFILLRDDVDLAIADLDNRTEF